MFNIGGDDKKKLKENMEEIRNLVNSESEQEEPKTQQETPDMPDKPAQQTDQQEMNQLESSVQKDNQSASLGTEQDGQTTEQRSFSPDENSGSANSQEGLSSRQDMKDHLESISSEVKKMDDGERNHGDTLFLEVDEFNQVQSMVEEMKYLSREMKDLMNNLDEGIEEDRRIEGEAEDVVEDFAERREKIQSALQ